MARAARPAVFATKPDPPQGATFMYEVLYEADRVAVVIAPEASILPLAALGVFGLRRRRSAMMGITPDLRREAVVPSVADSTAALSARGSIFRSSHRSIGDPLHAATA